MARYETIACCWACWHKARPTRAPLVVKDPNVPDLPMYSGQVPTEKCGLCGFATRSGIFVRAEVMPEGSWPPYRVPDWKHPWPHEYEEVDR